MVNAEGRVDLTASFGGEGNVRYKYYVRERLELRRLYLILIVVDLKSNEVGGHT